MQTWSTERGTLLVFTVGARQEALRRRLLPPHLSNFERALHSQCLESTLAAGRTSRCRLLVASPDCLTLGKQVHHLAQQGTTFKERLRHAYADARRRYDGPLLLVGSDTPDLTSDHLRAALLSLEQNGSRVVLGPSPDGGFYLLATMDPLPEEIWSQVQWRSRRTLSTLLQALREAGRPIELLPMLTDLDHRSDLQSWLASIGGPGSGGNALRPPMQAWGLLLIHLRRLLKALCRVAIPPQLGSPLAMPIFCWSGRAPPS